jgi:hypothetical protein
MPKPLGANVQRDPRRAWIWRTSRAPLTRQWLADLRQIRAEHPGWYIGDEEEILEAWWLMAYAENSLTRRHRPCVPRAARMAAMQRAGGSCAYCRTTERLEIDHIVALANGGANDDSNLQVLCRVCNARKGAR